MENVTDPVVPPVTPPAPEPAPEMVPKAEFERAMADLHKYKNAARELQAKTATEREALLREQGRWEELAKEKEAALKELQEKSLLERRAVLEDKKYTALKEAALKSGIRPEALADLELVGLDKVQVETTSTGRIIVNNVDNVIENLKMVRAHWFQPGRTVIGGGDPQITNPTGVVTTEDLIKLGDQARKTGDYTAYEQATKAYQRKK